MTVERLDLGEDDGFLDVIVAGEEYRIDAWEANDLIYDYSAANKGKEGAAFHRGLAQELTRLGLPVLSNQLVPALMRGVNDKVQRLKKNASGSPGSPASTDSTPEVSAPASGEPTTS